MKKSFIINSKVWRWPGDTGWHFVTLDKKIYEQIRKIYPKGFVKINAQIGKTNWDTSLFPHKLSGYLICVNNSVRKKENIFAGETVKIRVVLK